MLSELLGVLFGNFILGIIAVVVVGFFVGALIKSSGGRIFWWIFFSITILASLAASDTIKSYDQMARIGLIPDNYFGFISFGSLLSIIAFYTISQMFGTAVRKFGESEAEEKIENLTDAELLEIIELILSRPEISSTPWVSTKWYQLGSQTKQDWVRNNSSSIKKFLIDQGGLDEFGHSDLIVELQRLDRASREVSLIGVVE